MSKSHLKPPSVPHCLRGIRSPSQCAHHTLPTTSWVSLSLPHLHPLNNLRAPRFTSRSSLQAARTVGYSPLLCRMKSGSHSPSAGPLSLCTPIIHCSIMTYLYPVYSAHPPTLQPPWCLLRCMQALATSFYPATQRYIGEKKMYCDHISVWKYCESLEGIEDNLLSSKHLSTEEVTRLFPLDIILV